MNVENIGELERVLQLVLKYPGIRKLVWRDMTVEVAPSPLPAALPASEDEVPVVCRCGHDASEHSDCGCLLGCPVSVCAPDRKSVV